ncbi:MAG: FAD:protein FMN transferase [Patescibacteria group bacterium]|nr:FAD:protein FMN transferase [Patescibacteria group bacterium]MCL5224085.1 FAD:protein FMN transferase [Patescibacteria group bacterium]
MKQTKIVMGMPISVEIVGQDVDDEVFDDIFGYFRYIDDKFSTYKAASEISRINNDGLGEKLWSNDMKLVFALSERTKKETDGYFDIRTPAGKYDPSGLVKGWSVRDAAKILKEMGFNNFYINAGGDVQTSGKNAKGGKWLIGIKDPFNQSKIVKSIYLSDGGVATSGTYIRGLHIYNPKNGKVADEILSLTVIGPDVYEADRFATAAFAMGLSGIQFVERLEGFEGYAIDKNGVATMTSGLDKYTA